MAGPGELCITEDVYAADGVGDLLASVSLEREALLLKGIRERRRRYRVSTG
jgi:hypothetical protein